jgi:N-acetylglucosamine kinase
MQCFLGVDAGGSKCEALLASADGAILGWGVCGPDDPAAGTSWGGSGRSRESVQAAVRRALGERRPAQLCVSGLGRFDVPELMAQIGQARIEAVPVAEWQAPLALADRDHGLVVLAGTGAFVHGVAPDGREVHVDGAGPLLGDDGSGSQIGSLALRAVAKATYHPRHDTVLVDVVRDVLDIDVWGHGLGPLVAWAHEPRDRSGVASLARYVDAAAAAGDAVAIEILDTAAGNQAERVRDALLLLDLADTPSVMVAAGSVAVRSTCYWPLLCAKVAAFAPRLEPLRPTPPQAVGMVLAAMRRVKRGDRAALLAAAEARWEESRPR